MVPARGCLATRVLAAALVVLGLALRMRALEEPALFIDEAESGLNALSILEHGLPRDGALGLPMFENTLTEPWPESAEYEFRDTSYSDAGLAVYHGWLPLYAMAASLALHGIGPDTPTVPPRVQHDEDAIRTRVRAIRLPSVLFAGLFLVAIHWLGRLLGGREAGLAALLAAALSPKCVWIAQQARYYSAALALGTLAVALAWKAHRRGRGRDFLWLGGALVLLFHTSSLAFAIVLLALLPLLFGVRRQPRAGAKLAALAAVVLVGLLPWMLWTGYLEHLGRIPMARDQLAFPADYLVYFAGRPGSLLLALALPLVLLGLWLARARLPRRVAARLARARFPLAFLGGWLVAAFLGFQLLVPAASASMARLAHGLVPGSILLAAVLLAALARGLFPGRARAATLGGMALYLVVCAGLREHPRANPYEARAFRELVAHLRGLELAPDARVYALPYQHFCLSFATGLPVQSIAPVRREFLDSHPGEILILETAARLPPPRWSDLVAAAARAGVELDAVEEGAWLARVQACMVQSEVAPLVASFQPDPGPQPAWVTELVAELRREADVDGRGKFFFANDNPAMFAGTGLLSFDEFWPRFFYRFVGPEARSGAHVNYAGRMREAHATMLSSSWIVLACPARAAAAGSAGS